MKSDNMIEKVEKVPNEPKSLKKKKLEAKVKKRKADINREKSEPRTKKSKQDLSENKNVAGKRKSDISPKKSIEEKGSATHIIASTVTSATNECRDSAGAEKKKFSRPDELLAAKKIELDVEECPGAVDLNEVDFDLNNDFDFGPGTLESDVESDGNDNDDDFRAQRTKDKTDFYDGFAKDENYQDAWDTILSQVRGKFVHNLKDTVAKIMEQHKSEEGKGFEELDNTINEEEEDDFKLKPGEERRIERLKMQPDKKLKVQREEECKEDKVIFEEAIPAREGITFLEMNLSRPVLKAIEEMGFEIPTPIQATAIPIALQGRDICGCAATGTGKTAAYLLPIIERLLFKPKEDLAIRVLILTPTRELGLQVYEVTRELTKFTPIATAISVGGLSLKLQQSSLKKVPDIVIATPGRLIDHLTNSPSFHIHDVEVLVLDEADRMLEENFESQMKKIIEQCPKNRQTMLFSATMTMQVRELAIVSLKNPVKIFTNNNTEVAMNLRQEAIRIRFEKTLQRDAILLYLVLRYFKQHTLIFAPTRTKAHRLHIMFTCAGVDSGELHGDLKQIDRVEALRKFKDQKIDVLIATDVAARGLDIRGIQTVINYTLPREYSRYVHRVGRTARAGRCGRSISLVADNEFRLLQRIRTNSKQPIFERVIKKEILGNYWTRVQEMEPVIDRILEQEKEDIHAMRVAAHARKDKSSKEYQPRVNKKWLSELPKDVNEIGRRRMKTLKIERPKLAKKLMNKQNAPAAQPKRDMCSKAGKGQYKAKSLKWGNDSLQKAQKDHPGKRRAAQEEARPKPTSFDKDLVGVHGMRTSLKGKPLPPGKKGANNSEPGRFGSDKSGPGRNGPGFSGRGRNGPGISGRGRNGPGTSGRGRNGPGTSGRGRNGPGTSSRGRFGPGTSGRGRNGPGTSSRGRFGSDRNGPGTSGRGRFGSDRNGPGNSGPGRFGAGKSGPGNRGPSKSGRGRGRRT